MRGQPLICSGNCEVATAWEGYLRLTRVSTSRGAEMHRLTMAVAVAALASAPILTATPVAAAASVNNTTTHTQPAVPAGPRVQALGDIDELNCCLGLLLEVELPATVRAHLAPCQHELFNLGNIINTF